MQIMERSEFAPGEGSSSQFSKSVRYNFIHWKMLSESGDFIRDSGSIPGVMCEIPVTPNSCH